MSLATLENPPPSRLKALLDHFGEIDDPRVPWQVAKGMHDMPECVRVQMPAQDQAGDTLSAEFNLPAAEIDANMCPETIVRTSDFPAPRYNGTKIA